MEHTLFLIEYEREFELKVVSLCICTEYVCMYVTPSTTSIHSGNPQPGLLFIISEQQDMNVF